MQFVIIAQDGQDEGALNRRLAARDSHVAYSDIAAKSGEQIMAAATLDNDGKMNGSVMVVEFDSIDDVNKWLDTESYVVEGVWQHIQVIPCKVAPSFDHLIKKK